MLEYSASGVASYLVCTVVFELILWNINQGMGSLYADVFVLGNEELETNYSGNIMDWTNDELFVDSLLKILYRGILDTGGRRLLIYTRGLITQCSLVLCLTKESFA